MKLEKKGNVQTRKKRIMIWRISEEEIRKQDNGKTREKGIQE
jgi:hypothetical protein